MQAVQVLHLTLKVSQIAIQLAGILEHTPEKMALWIHNPQEQKPGNKMPAFGKEAGGKLMMLKLKILLSTYRL